MWGEKIIVGPRSQQKSTYRPMKSFVSADVWNKMGENLINLICYHEKHDQMIFS